MAEAKVTHALQDAAAAKDTEIQALQAQLAAGEVARKLAVTEALGAVSQERDALAKANGYRLLLRSRQRSRKTL